MYSIGIDIGGMSIKCGVVKDGEILCKKSVQSDKNGGGDKLVQDIKKLVEDTIKEIDIHIDEISNIGVGVPGPVTEKHIVTLVNLGVIDYELDKNLKEVFPGIKIMVANDANVAALCEARFGSMKDYNSGVMITLGTGVGGGIVINNNLLTGAHGIGAELGHTIIGENYYDCNCGNNGCFETFCSATAIIKYAQKLILEGTSTILNEMSGNNIENVTAKIVFDSYKKNDDVAVEVINRFNKYLAIGLGNIVNFMDPDVISIGGGVSNANEILLDGLEERIKKHLPFRKTNIAKIKIATFKNDAGILGASEL